MNTVREIIHAPHLSAPPPRPPQPVGLGDAVARVAQPIARALDAVLGTKITGCGGCAERQRKLNELMPDISKFSQSTKQL